MPEKRACPHCHGVLTSMARVPLDKVIAVHEESCPAALRVKRGKPTATVVDVPLPAEPAVRKRRYKDKV